MVRGFPLLRVTYFLETRYPGCDFLPHCSTTAPPWWGNAGPRQLARIPVFISVTGQAAVLRSVTNVCQSYGSTIWKLVPPIPSQSA